eukprot:TRINITY_DN25614_c0_g1_i1.p1 TRINITY_DN25614_c0_g1~~TRINITY_DN25614_c0_g1_i1.p1  ORF type:complete len:1009 (+),score=124.85 TRINITY_DN25614_c0_g1_i1:422-3028(+)
MAAAHWVVAIWEDWRSWTFLNGGLAPKDFHESGDILPSGILVLAYTIHHIFAACAYIMVLRLQSCVAVCTFGLVFEIPVLLLTHREFAINADVPPAWFRTPRGVERLWTLLTYLFVCARFLPTCVYVYAVIFWWKELRALSKQESVIFHGMALFFSVLNWVLFVSILTMWRNKDTKEAAGLIEDGARAFGTPFGKVDSDKDSVDHNAMPVHMCTPEDVAMCDGTGESGQMLVEIDGTAYDITSFLKEHPGGDVVLRKHAGKDASEAFHRARHSASAKMHMLKYMIGPIRRPLERYTIFSHSQEMSVALNYALYPVLTYVMTLLLFHFTALLGGDLLGQDDTLVVSIVPGLCTSVVVGACAFVAAVARGFLGFSLLTSSAFFLSMKMTLFICSLVMVRRPLLSSLPSYSPTGLELGAALLLFLEDLRELFSGGQGPWSANSFFPAIAMIASWLLRGAVELVETAPSHAWGALLLVVTTSSIVRAVPPQSQQERRQVFPKIVGGAVLVGPIGLFGLALITAHSEDRAEMVLHTIRTQGTFELVSFAAVVILVMVVLLQMTNSAYTTSQAWTVRLYALTSCSAVVLGNGHRSWRWLFTIGLLLYFGELGHRLRTSFDAAAAKPGGFAKVAQWRVGTQGWFDQVRVALAIVIWRPVCSALVFIIKQMLPEEVCVYACDIPIFDLGDSVDLGFAAYYAPARKKNRCASKEEAGPGQEPENKPEFFVCNVGHIDTVHEAGLQDMQRTMNALRDVWTEFKSDKPQGLVANLVAVFPFVQGTTSAKEINLSAWSSSEDAHAWYYKSKGHRYIMEQHTSGYLRSFGNLLASLEPIDGVRFQDRCQRCSRLVESTEAGRPPPLRCGFCGARTFDYPLF